MSVSRRGFLVGAAAALVGCSRKTDRLVSGDFVDDGGAVGHALRDGTSMSAPTRTERVPVVIVGGGIAGLSAAWRLEKQGFRDFVLLELEDEVGGNARWGENEITPFPWAAHYVPVPGPQAGLVRELFEDLGAFSEGLWDESMLVYAPHERLFRWGAWREGLVSSLADSPGERAEFRRFDELISGFREGGEFTVPSALGAPAGSPLDQISFRQWLIANGFNEPALLWHADYACRDDYGVLASATSAWAGIHYFAARPPDEPGPLAWPEGNGWVVRRLMERLGDYVRTGAPVHRVQPRRTDVSVVAGDTEYVCEGVVWAAPSFLAPYVVEGAPPVDISYSPWLTANLTLERPPRERGVEVAWDNVIYDSPALGYVVANHQTLATHRGRSVWTWYLAVADRPPEAARELLQRRSWGDWRDYILADLERCHPDIRECVSRIDVMRLGHAMVRPVPGFLSSPGRQALRSPEGPVVYANSDLSGLSLFEEAQYRGVTAADRVLARVGGG